MYSLICTYTGMFAKDRHYQKSKLAEKAKEEKGGKKETSPDSSSPAREEGEDSSDEDVLESDEECQRVLESGGRDRCAYFFWQGKGMSCNDNMHVHVHGLLFLY